MKKHAISPQYEHFLQEARSHAVFFSGATWDLSSEHDPGLTQLEILVNALALARDRYDTLPDSSCLLPITGHGARWNRPEQTNTFVFQADSSLPAKSDFAAVPAGRTELCRNVETIPGLHRAWIVQPEGAEEPLPKMVVAFAPVLPTGGSAFALTPETTQAQSGLDHKDPIVQEVNNRLAQWQELCRPALRAEEIRLAPLEAGLILELAVSPEKPHTLLALVAELMTAVEEYLRPRGAIPRTISPSEMHAFLVYSFEKTQANGHNVLKGIHSVCLRNAAGQRAFAREILSLGQGYDAFDVTQWNIRVGRGGDYEELSKEDLRHAAYLAQCRLTEKLYREQWRVPETREPLGEAAWYQAVVEETGKPAYLHEQFPACYNVASVESGSVGENQAESRQLQGWLFLFEQILADALLPLRDPAALFVPRVPKAEELCADTESPLLSVLTDGPAYRIGMGDAVRQGGEFLRRCEDLLLHLAALQGEVPWFVPEDTIQEGSLPSANAGHRLGLLTYWLRHLPWLNGRRLLRNSSQAGMSQVNAGNCLLEQRLAILLLPFTLTAPAPAQRFFDIRVERNTVTGQDEYRCYIRDAEQRLRIICKIAASSLEEAEFIGLYVMRLAGSAEQYHITDKDIHIGWLAVLAEEDPTMVSDAPPNPFDRIRETTMWVKTSLPSWVEIVDYTEIGEDRPFELAVLLEQTLVPPAWQPSLKQAIQEHIPAHILAHVFFITPEERGLIDSLLYRPEKSTEAHRHDTRARLRELILSFEGKKDKASLLATATDPLISGPPLAEKTSYVC
ncbi:hypothetical protein [Desulfovibrio cuneatus]|uniref:hypothetical protein n=1 Tax=Desulfovibrio cuneatus TaxID=159728 RepID=UPI00041B5C4E|nr:hypothetical protein [Desulfovibrio cuneatus]